MQKQVLIVLTGIAFLLGGWSCSSSGSSDPTTSTEVNGLEASYPSDLAVTSPFATDFALEGLTRLSPRAQATNEEIELQDYRRRKRVIRERIEGAANDDCAFVFSLFKNVLGAQCYGPAISYTNHPDQPGTDGSLPPGDLGIWEEAEPFTGAPCVVRKVNSLISESQAKIDMAIDLVTAMLCLANVAGKDALPAVGERVGLLAQVNEGLAASDTPFTATGAGIAREEDDADGNPTYLSTVSGTAAIPSPNAQVKQISTNVFVRHIPTNADNTTYKGILWFKITGELGSPGGNCPMTGPKLFAGSVFYSKESDTRLIYRYQHASYCSESSEPFDDDNIVDPSNKKTGGNPRGWANSFAISTLELSTEDGTGTFSYAWQAGPLDGHARTFLAELESDDSSGAKSGCGYYGFGPDVAASDGVGDIDGMICNWAGPNNTRTVQEKVQRQCVSLDTDTEKWESDGAQLAISYGPVNDCSVEAGDSATFGGKSELPDNLIPLAAMQSAITAPTPPSTL